MTRAARAEYKAWLEGLKPGDEAAVVHSGMPGENNFRIMKVMSVVPDAIRMNDHAGGMRFYKSNGMVVDRSFHGPHRLSKITQEMRDIESVRVARNRLLGSACMRGISDAKALRIVAILDEPETTT